MDPRQNTNRSHPIPDRGETAFDASIVRALERAPQVSIPPDFAARMAARVIAEPHPNRSPWAGFGPGFGPRIALVSGALLTGTLFAFAAHATPSLFDLRFDMEMLVLLELGLVGFVLTRIGLHD